MVKLLNTVSSLKGLGRDTNTSAILVKRKGDICWYKRTDDVHEVFKVQTVKKEIIFGKTYPEREVYPNNESFGKTAWCFTNKDNALNKFNQLCS